MKQVRAVFLIAMMVLAISLSSMAALAAGTPTIQCADVVCDPGDRIEVPVMLKNNPGMMVVLITPQYASELGTPTVINGSLFTDITMDRNYIWVADNDITADGTLFAVSFDVPEDLAPGKYPVSVIFREACNYNEELVSLSVKAGSVTVQGTTASAADTSAPETLLSKESNVSDLTEKETSDPIASRSDEPLDVSSQPTANEAVDSEPLLVTPNPIGEAEDVSSDESVPPSESVPSPLADALAANDDVAAADAPDSESSSSLWLKVAVFALVCLAAIAVLVFAFCKMKKNG